LLQDDGIESHVVDAASIATSRRRRRAKTDKIDGEALVRALLAYKRGEPRVCAMVRVPTPHEEHSRRICRERTILTAERVEHVNRIKGLLFAQVISDYEPLLRKRRAPLAELNTGDGRPLPEHLKAQIERELDRLELTLEQIKAVETERDAADRLLKIRDRRCCLGALRQRLSTGDAQWAMPDARRTVPGSTEANKNALKTRSSFQHCCAQ
jgi:transposase